jgi:hypothetical protein
MAETKQNGNIEPLTADERKLFPLAILDVSDLAAGSIMNRPRRRDGWVWACNGHVCVRYPEGAISTQGLLILDAGPHDYSAAFEGEAGTQVRLPDWKQMESSRCPLCFGVGAVRTCPECQGEGVKICPTCDHEANCSECGGRGVLASRHGLLCRECCGLGKTLPEKIPLVNEQGKAITGKGTLIGPSVIIGIAGHYLALLYRHGVKSVEVRGPDRGMAFQLADGCEGLVMPVRLGA